MFLSLSLSPIHTHTHTNTHTLSVFCGGGGACAGRRGAGARERWCARAGAPAVRQGARIRVDQEAGSAVRAVCVRCRDSARPLLRAERRALPPARQHSRRLLLPPHAGPPDRRASGSAAGQVYVFAFTAPGAARPGGESSGGNSGNDDGAEGEGGLSTAWCGLPAAAAAGGGSGPAVRLWRRRGRLLRPRRLARCLAWLRRWRGPGRMLAWQ